MTRRFFAHSINNPDQSDWQPLPEHLQAVGALAAALAQVFGAGALARASGLLHDLGKYTDGFQRRLCGEFPRLDHATWGARIAIERYPQIGHLLAYGIAGHHAGLANGRTSEGRTSLHDRVKAEPEHELLPVWQQEISLPQNLGLPDGFQPRTERGAFQLALLSRMLFSCLVDADFVDTDEFYRRVEGRPSRHVRSVPSLLKLRERLNERLAGFKADSEVNSLRADVLAHVRAQAGQMPGLFSLTVPTGGGKTLASLAFALDHAIAHGLRRVIFVIPFTSIVEQNAKVFRDAFGDLGEDAVLEHHSAFIESPATAFESKDKRRLAMENRAISSIVREHVAMRAAPSAGAWIETPWL